MSRYDIFISYRRNGGWETAKHLYDLMTHDGYSVSFDIDTLRDGLFDIELLKRIEECTDFIVILDEHVFDRTLQSDTNRNNDWLRVELAHAIKMGKNIIPIMLKGLKGFPKDLPDDIKDISRYNGPKFDSYYFDSFYHKLLSEFIHSVPTIHADNNAGCLKVYTNVDCRVFIDFEDKGIAHPGQIMRIPMGSGTYCLRFESLNDKSTFILDEDFTITNGIEKLYKVNLPTHNDVSDDNYEKGLQYYNGEGAIQDYEKAFLCFNEAAGHGSKDALNDIGNCYFHGYYVKQDYALAAQWYKRGAEADNNEAMRNLGLCYKYGWGVSQDYSKAVYWFEKAAMNGLASAMNNLGVCYETGMGVSVNYEKAAYWYRKSADKGEAAAMNNLGVCYYNGLGLVQSYEKAAEWYKKGAAKGHDKSINNLAACYHKGTGVSKNYDHAVYWYKKAALLGNESAIKNLSMYFRHGIGVTENQLAADRLEDAYRLVKANQKSKAITMINDILNS